MSDETKPSYEEAQTLALLALRAVQGLADGRGALTGGLALLYLASLSDKYGADAMRAWDDHELVRARVHAMLEGYEATSGYKPDLAGWKP